MRARLTIAAFLLLAPTPVGADTAGRLAGLVSAMGVSGHEAPVREAIEMLLPAGARVRADNLGNIFLQTGNGPPHTLVAAPLDESGFVVSAITGEGYLRVHRHTTPPAPPLATQYFIGQMVRIRTASGRIIDGVTATPSIHLRAFRHPTEEGRIRDVDDIWVDIGAESRAEVQALGVRVLDSVTLRERVTRLAGGRVSGVAASNRAAALAIAELIRRSSGRGATGTVTLAWVTQSQFVDRGLRRLIEMLAPDRVIALGGTTVPGDDPRGSIGRLGGGPIVAGGDSLLLDAAARAGVTVQAGPASRLPTPLADRSTLTVHLASVPVRYAQTPVETVDAGDVDTLAALLAASVGLSIAPPDAASTGAMAAGPDQSREPGVTGAAGATDAAGSRDAAGTRGPAQEEMVEVLKRLVEAPGVSGHEGPVREAILKRLPAWARPRVDERGNVTVTFGTGGRHLLFIAHMDEVGFEITALAADGRASVRARGGMSLSLYEAHPMLVHTPGGPVPAVLVPRERYLTATEAQPALAALSLDFGSESLDDTRALGVAPGQSVTVRKSLLPLGASRAAARSMDDRSGSTALLLVLRRIDPARVPNRVTFAWSVEEETSLSGASHLAGTVPAETVFAVDTFVSSDTPVETRRVAGAVLGRGAVLRALDSRTIVTPADVDSIVAVARDAKVPLQIGATGGATDASVFSAIGAIDVGLSWPGRYSHSPVEVVDLRDLDALVRLIAALVAAY